MKKTTATKSTKKNKKRAASVTRSYSAQPASFWTTYQHQSEAFFNTHPNSRMLLGLFIVVFAVFIGLLFHDKAQAMGWKTTYHYYN